MEHVQVWYVLVDVSRLALNCSTSTFECDGNKVNRLIDGFWFRGPKRLPMSLVEHKFQVDYTAQMRKYYVTVKNWHKIRRRPMEVLLATHDLTTRMRAVE